LNFTGPKTERSNRVISISSEVIEALRQHRRLQLEQKLAQTDYRDFDLIFATDEGGPLNWRNLTRRHLKPLLKAAGVAEPGVSMYTLRHTNAAAQIRAGVHVRVIAERLGTSIAMISATYAHVEEELNREVSDKLAAMLYGT
jgi:integrase